MSLFTPHKRKQVALLIETSNQYARGLLEGINAYQREHASWSVFLGELSRNNKDMSWLGNWHGDGILARIETEQTAEYIRNCGLPAIDLSAFRKIPTLPCVETNDQAIAEMAAEHFLERGFRHFAFYGNAYYQWSIQREMHYAQYLQDKGYSCLRFESSDQEELQGESWQLHKEKLIQWLQSLPKPIGILACYDICGQQLLEACRLAGVEVPDEVAVVGVDNDRLLCELSNPPLSSIQTNARRAGYLAAELLDRQMAGECLEAQVHQIEPIDLQVRLSSDVLAIEDKLVSEAVRFIRRCAHEDIQVSDILAHIPVTRRVLESRFIKALGRTPHDEILAVKLKLVKQLLTETKLPLSAVAERAGFKHTEYMSVVFNRLFGMRPGQYRKLKTINLKQNPD